MTATTKPLCIYHGNCADGFTAAWAVWRATGDLYEFHPGVYQNPPPDVAGRGVVFVDFSYKRDVIEEMRKTAAWIRIIDHHKTAIEDLQGQLRDDPKLCPVELIFDIERSGAGLAWDVYHAGAQRPALVDYVEDRDLWRFRFSGSREVSAYIFSHAYDFVTWDKLAGELQIDIDGVIRAGAAIERKHHKDIAELVKALRREMVIGGHTVPVANLPYTLTSDAGNLMCGPYDTGLGGVVIPPFAACYWDTAEGRVFSLRSVGDFDVSEIAKLYGGGGHKNASGFRLAHGQQL